MPSIDSGLEWLRVGKAIAPRCERFWVARPQPADGSRHELLRRLGREDPEHRLEAMQRATNHGAEH